MKMAWYVLRRELNTLPRQRWFYWKRVGIVLLGAAVVGWGLGVAHLSQSTTVGLEIFTLLAFATLFAVCLLSANTAATIVVREKEDRTLGLLLLSDVTPGRFLLGKLLTGLFSTVMGMLTVLPLFILVVAMGGVATHQILWAFAVLLSTVFLGTCAGLCVSSLARSERAASSLLLLWLLTFYLVLPVGVALFLDFHYPKIRLAQPIVSVLSPFMAMASLTRGVNFAGAHCGLNMTLGAIGLGLATLILPRRVFSRERPPLGQQALEVVRDRRRLRRWRTPPRAAGNPIAWRDFHFLHGGHAGTWLKFAAAIAAVAALTLYGALRPPHPTLEGLGTVVLTVLLIFSAAVFGLGSVSHAGMAFQRERKERTLEILLTTSLDERAIIEGKIRAMIFSLLPWLLCALACAFTLACMYLPSWKEWSMVSIFALEYVAAWFGYTCLALWLSLRLKKNAAFGVCLLLFLGWNIFGRMVMSLFFALAKHFDPYLMVFLDVIAHFMLGVICLQSLYRTFRATALREIA